MSEATKLAIKLAKAGADSNESRGLIMSLYIDFEPHSWYMGFAIQKRILEKEVIDDTPINYYLWQAYTDDGNTYSIINKHARSLKELKKLIREYHLNAKNGYSEHTELEYCKQLGIEV